MARRPLAGGYTEIAVGVGQDHLAELDAELPRLGIKSRAEWFRRASVALLQAMRRPVEVAPVSETDVVDDVDPDDATDDLEEVVSGPGHTGAIIPRGASAMARGRWAGWYPLDLSDAEVVADLRRIVPGGTVTLRRPRSNPDALIHAYVDTPAEAERLACLGSRPSPFYRVIGPDDPA